MNRLASKSCPVNVYGSPAESGAMRKKILILEDDDRRVSAMREWLEERLYPFECVVFESASEFIAYVENGLDEVALVSLDHDLNVIRTPTGDVVDLGTGRQVAEYLATHEPAFPVVIRSSNVHGAIAMNEVLAEANWRTYSVTPYGDLDWVDEVWFPVVRRAILDSV